MAKTIGRRVVSGEALRQVLLQVRRFTRANHQCTDFPSSPVITLVHWVYYQATVPRDWVSPEPKHCYCYYDYWFMSSTAFLSELKLIQESNCYNILYIVFSNFTHGALASCMGDCITKVTYSLHAIFVVAKTTIWRLWRHANCVTSHGNDLAGVSASRMRVTAL
jgi:hypothetical protein